MPPPLTLHSNTVDEILHDIREADDGSFITAELSENAGDGTAEGGAEEKLVGCVRSQVDLSQLRGNFGPFAVHPSAQGHGTCNAPGVVLSRLFSTMC